MERAPPLKKVKVSGESLESWGSLRRRRWPLETSRKFDSIRWSPAMAMLERLHVALRPDQLVMKAVIIFPAKAFSLLCSRRRLRAYRHS